MTGKKGLLIRMRSDEKQGEDLVFVYPNDLRGGFMLQYVLGVTSMEDMATNGLKTVHTINGDMRIGADYVRVAKYA